MIFFSILVQAAEGSTFGIVPYVDATVTGSVAGLVGAGGNVGGVCFALLFRSLPYRSAFMFMGLSVIGSSLFTMALAIPGHRGLVTGDEAPAVAEHRRKAKLPAVIVLEPTASSTARRPNADGSVMENTVADGTLCE